MSTLFALSSRSVPLPIAAPRQCWCQSEWRRIEATLEDRIDRAAVRAFRDSPSETFPDAIVAVILAGAHPVKAMREHRNITQRKLAAAVDTSAIYISQIERGKRHAGRRLLAKLGKALAVDSELPKRDEA